MIYWCFLTNRCYSLIRGIKGDPDHRLILSEPVPSWITGYCIGPTSILPIYIVYRRPHSIIWIIGVISVCFQFHVHIVRRVQRKHSNHPSSSRKKIWVDKYVEFGRNKDKKKSMFRSSSKNSSRINLCFLLFFHQFHHVNIVTCTWLLVLLLLFWFLFFVSVKYIFSMENSEDNCC